jgi:hypothetical protein
MIKFANTFKENKMCTSHLSHPTKHPQAGPNLDPLENPNRHIRSHRSLASRASTSQKRIIILDYRPCYVSIHEVTPPQHPRILWGW